MGLMWTNLAIPNWGTTLYHLFVWPIFEALISLNKWRFNPEKMVHDQDPTMKRNFIMKWSEHLGSNF